MIVYMTNAKVESRPHETKTKPKCPVDLYKLQDTRKPKAKRSSKPHPPTSQSYEPVIVVSGTSDIHSSLAEPSTHAMATDSKPPLVVSHHLHQH